MFLLYIGQMESLYNPFHLFEGEISNPWIHDKIQHFKISSLLAD